MENKKSKKDIVKMLLKQTLNDEDEQSLMEVLIDEPITVNVEKQEEKTLTIGDRAADKFSALVGSWGFILGFTGFLLFWLILNGILLKNAIDPYPFILLNLILSCVAAIQAPIIMMSQNREAKRDALRNENDYRTDLKSELILEDLHDKIAILIKNQNKIIQYIETSDNETTDDTKNIDNVTK